MALKGGWLEGKDVVPFLCDIGRAMDTAPSSSCLPKAGRQMLEYYRLCRKLAEGGRKKERDAFEGRSKKLCSHMESVLSPKDHPQGLKYDSDLVSGLQYFFCRFDFLFS